MLLVSLVTELHLVSFNFKNVAQFLNLILKVTLLVLVFDLDQLFGFFEGTLGSLDVALFGCLLVREVALRVFLFFGELDLVAVRSDVVLLLNFLDLCVLALVFSEVALHVLVKRAALDLNVGDLDCLQPDAPAVSDLTDL